MEKKLKLFIPERKINPWLLTMLLLWLIAMLFNILYSKFSSYEIFEILGVIFVIIAFVYSVGFIIGNLFAYEPTYGKFSGYLIIDNEKIICDNDIHRFSEIEKISILSNHIRGNYNWNIRAWQQKKSNGIKNYIEIFNKNGEYKKYFFLQTKTENIEMFSEELRTYYRFGKLGEQNYKNIIGERHNH
jgi:hypothetical protein